MLENPWVMLVAGLVVEHFIGVIKRFIPPSTPAVVKKAEVVQKVVDAVKAKGVVA